MRENSYVLRTLAWMRRRPHSRCGPPLATHESGRPFIQAKVHVHVTHVSFTHLRSDGAETTTLPREFNPCLPAPSHILFLWLYPLII